MPQLAPGRRERSLAWTSGVWVLLVTQWASALAALENHLGDFNGLGDFDGLTYLLFWSLTSSSKVKVQLFSPADEETEVRRTQVAEFKPRALPAACLPTLQRVGERHVCRGALWYHCCHSNVSKYLTECADTTRVNLSWKPREPVFPRLCRKASSLKV